MNMPLFSIIIPNYNNGRFIKETLNSVIKQTYINWEAVIVDDCSTDNSFHIIKEFLNQDERIRCYRNKKNRGVGYCKRLGVTLAKGKIIGTLGADDVLDRNAFKEMVWAHSNSPTASLVYSAFQYCDKNLNAISRKCLSNHIVSNETYLTCNSPASIGNFRAFKKSYYDRTDGYNKNFRKAVDKDIIYKLEEVGNVVFLDHKLYFYRLHDKNISLNNNVWTAALWEVKAREKAYYRRLGTDIPNISKETLKKEYYYVLKNLAIESLGNNDFFSYIRYCYIYIKIFKNPISLLKFIYYSFKKSYRRGNFR